jgi:hypothetical protein
MFSLFQIKVAVYLLDQNEKKLLISLPKFNYCDLLRSEDQFIGVKLVIEMMSKNGNMTSGCPVNPGYLYLKNHFLEDKAFPIFLFNKNNSEYLMNVNITDENGKKVKKAFDASFYMTYIN